MMANATIGFQDIISPYQLDIVLVDENPRLPYPSTICEDYHPYRIVYLCHRIRG